MCGFSFSRLYSSLSLPLTETQMPHEGRRTLEQLVHREVRSREVDPRERGIEFLKICGSSSGEVCDFFLAVVAVYH